MLGLVPAGKHCLSAGPWWRLPRSLARRTATVLAATGLIVAAGAVGPVVADAVPLLPVADSFVDEDNPNRNSGSASYLRADASPERTSYLKFDLGSAASASTALLRIHVESSNTNTHGVQVRTVSRDDWSEATITARTAPPVGAVLDETGPTQGGTTYDLDVSGALDGDGVLSLALTTPATTAIKITSREGLAPPEPHAPAPVPASSFEVRRLAGNEYAAVGDDGTTFAGALKDVVERAVQELMDGSGGTVRFTAGDFDLGTTFFKFYSIRNITFEGAGMDATHVRNSTSASADTEPFNFTGADGIVIQDMQVTAGGAARTTSDALDFDNGSDNVVERVRIAGSRGRGIVFDGKNDDWNADRNTIRDCVITGTVSKGIELLASRGNVIQGCHISSTGAIGIQANKSSSSADQPNKKSSDNLITGNTLVLAGGDGIQVNSGDRNQILGNRVLNSSTTSSGRDGIRISTSDGVTSEDNVVRGNVATDDRAEKRQNYGLNVVGASALRTVHGSNDFSGNRVGPVRDTGSGTVAE